MKAITGELDLNLFNADDEDNTSFDPAAAMDTLKTVGEFALDMTPVVGDIKGAVELPEDLATAKQMIEQGYDEGDIMSMGLGGALGALSVAGLVPMAGSLADAAQAPVKAAVKSRLADQTDAMLDKGLAGRGRKTVDVEEAEFSGEPKEKPTPKIFHGSRSMNAPRSGEAAKYESTMYKFKTQYINDPVYDLFADKESKLISKDTKSADDIVDGQGYGRFGIPVGETDGSIDIANVTFKKGKDGALDVHFIDIDKNIVEEEAVASIPANVDGDIVYDDMQSSLRELSNVISAKSGAVGEKRIDALKREGFSPFSDFKGESGLAGLAATGQHSELDEKLLSTSRDPLVSMKPAFGGTNTDNIVYADLPREATADMPPTAYTNKALAELEGKQIGYRLPKSLHLEAEEAIARPELLDVKALSDNPELAARVQRGQDTVYKIMDTAGNEPTELYEKLGETISTQEFNRKGYSIVKNVLSDLQSLGQFTEQYGARGTYDDLLEGLAKDSDGYGDFQQLLVDVSRGLPENSVRKRNILTVSTAMDALGKRSYSQSTERYKAAERLRNFSDKELKDALYSTKNIPTSQQKKLADSGLTIFMDGSSDMDMLGYKDIKRILMLATDNMNRGGLASRK